mmetsp:Transcript_16252/g.24290  ORF Transcript_16252/g.24290 Transcript_16252/m.24290 type:complete len:270 (+) Transcript_16252:1243-2052(+)
MKGEPVRLNTHFPKVECFVQSLQHEHCLLSCLVLMRSITRVPASLSPHTARVLPGRWNKIRPVNPARVVVSGNSSSPIAELPYVTFAQQILDSPRQGLTLVQARRLLHSCPGFNIISIPQVVSSLHVQIIDRAIEENRHTLTTQQDLLVKKVLVFRTLLRHPAIPIHNIRLTIQGRSSKTVVSSSETTHCQITSNETNPKLVHDGLHDIGKLHHVSLMKVVTMTSSSAMTAHDVIKLIIGHHAVEQLLGIHFESLLVHKGPSIRNFRRF